MHIRPLLSMGVLALVTAASCDRIQPPSGAAPPKSRAQPRLATLKLWVGPEELITEIASNAVQQTTGMMYRTNMAENEAMLFVFAWPHRAAFYMRNTYLPLSCAYVDSEGTIREIHSMEPRKEEAIVAASSQIRYVLETTRDWFARHRITTGMVIRTERGSLDETFFPRLDR